MARHPQPQFLADLDQALQVAQLQRQGMSHQKASLISRRSFAPTRPCRNPAAIFPPISTPDGRSSPPGTGTTPTSARDSTLTPTI
jgi:hypothetical protein